jgi:hypothetical protein
MTSRTPLGQSDGSSGRMPSSTRRGRSHTRFRNENGTASANTSHDSMPSEYTSTLQLYGWFAMISGAM